MTDAEAMLMAFEGTGPRHDGAFFPYTDSVGVTTIGYGHNLEAKGIPEDVALRLFKTDIGDALEAVRHNFSCYDQLSRPRQLVLISMGFQFGEVGLSKWPRFINAVHLGRYDEAAEELLNSKVAREQAHGRFATLATMMKEDVSQWV